MKAKIAAALEAGARFLVARQDADGAWRDFDLPGVGRAQCWATAYVASALRRAAPFVETPIEPSVAAAARYLTANACVNGGWGYCESVPADADSTSLVLLFLSDASLMHFAALARFQSPCGGFRTYLWPAPGHGWGEPQPEITATALRALSLCLTPEHQIIRSGLSWLTEKLSADPGAKAYWWEASNYLGLELVRLRATLREAPAARARLYALETAFETALGVELAMTAGQDPGRTGRLVEELLAARCDDGGWPSGARLRLPEARGDAARIFVDDRRLFTAAAVLSAFAAWLEPRRAGTSFKRQELR